MKKVLHKKTDEKTAKPDVKTPVSSEWNLVTESSQPPDGIPKNLPTKFRVDDIDAKQYKLLPFSARVAILGAAGLVSRNLKTGSKDSKTRLGQTWTIPFTRGGLTGVADGSGNIPAFFAAYFLQGAQNWSVYTNLFDFMRVRAYHARILMADYPSYRVVGGATPVQSYFTAPLGIVWDPDAIATASVTAMNTYDHKRVHWFEPGCRPFTLKAKLTPLILRPGSAVVDFGGDAWMDVASFNTTPTSYVGSFVSNAVLSGSLSASILYYNVVLFWEVEFAQAI